MKIKTGFKGELSLVLPKLITEMMEEDPMMSILHITDIGFYPKASHHYRQRIVPIDQYIFIYCVAGEGWYEIDGQRYNVAANQYFIIPANKPHIYAASDQNPWSIYWIHFRGTLAKYYASFTVAPQSVDPGITSRIHLRNELFDEIFATLSNSLTIESLRYAMSSFHHYLASLRYINEYRTVGTKNLVNDTVEATIHYMNENLEKHLTLKDIADYSGYSPSRLSAIFKEKTGYSPLGYFNVLRVRQACILLETTDLKLNQISPRLGIDDPLYFSRLFSKIMGKSPKAYRENPHE